MDGILVGSTERKRVGWHIPEGWTAPPGTEAGLDWVAIATFGGVLLAALALVLSHLRHKRGEEREERRELWRAEREERLTQQRAEQRVERQASQAVEAERIRMRDEALRERDEALQEQERIETAHLPG